MDLIQKILKRPGPLGAQADQAHGYFTYPKLEGTIGNRMMFGGKEKLVWSLNNYLGLAGDPLVREADAEGARQYGLAYPMGARMMSGNSMLHEMLEQKLSAFVQKEDTFLLNYGYQGMVSIIDSLLDRHDVVVYDAEAHACIIDGLRMHAGHRFVFKHNDTDDLRKQLFRAKKLTEGNDGGILVITEGVFGMRGDLGKLKGIAALKSYFGFTLLVDDAHGIGVMGRTGAGTGEHFEVQDDIDLYFATFAKAFAGIGAFVSGNADIIRYLRYNMRSQIFAKAMPMPMVYGLLQRLEMVRTMPGLSIKLWQIARELQNGLREAGLDIGNTVSPVTPVYLRGSVGEATALVRELREEHHIFCSLVVYPVVPRGLIMLRLIPTAVHTFADVYKTVKVLKELQAKLLAGAYQAAGIHNNI